MSSPNEPGYPRATEGGGNGSGSAPGPEGGSVGGAGSRGPLPGGSSPERTADATEVPPWQRGSRPPEQDAGTLRTAGLTRAAGCAAAPEQRSDEPLPRHRCPAEPVPLRRLGHGVTAGAGRGRVGRSTRAGRPEQSGRPEPTRSEAPARPEPPARPEQAARPEPPVRTEQPQQAREVRQRDPRPLRSGTAVGAAQAGRGASRAGTGKPSRGPGRAERRRPAAIRARCAPACRSAGWTRGAC